MINPKLVKSYCKEPIENIKGYHDAITDFTNMWECHHILEIQENMILSKNVLKQKGLYYNRPASELVFLTKKEHRRLHNLADTSKYAKSSKSLIQYYKTENGVNKRNQLSLMNKTRKHSDETKQKISNSNKGKQVSTDSRQKMSLAHKGMPGFWTGKTISNELRKKLRDTKLQMARYYREYKQKDGALSWKQWQRDEWCKIKNTIIRDSNGG